MMVRGRRLITWDAILGDNERGDFDSGEGRSTGASGDVVVMGIRGDGVAVRISFLM